LNIVNSIFGVIGHGILLCWHLLSFILRPLHYVAGYILDQILFLLQPFIIMARGIYILTVVWPTEFVGYLAHTFYPLYVFLACASIVGLIVGGVANFTSSFLNNTLFPRPPSHKP